MAKGQSDNHLKYNTLEEIETAHQELRQSFLTGKTQDIEFRKYQLKQLYFLINDNTERIIDTLKKDIGRCGFESTIAEIMMTSNAIMEAYNNIDKWARKKKKWGGLVWSLHNPTEYKEPKGTVLVLGPWNFAITVQVGPLIYAIAAGNTVILKPSEVAHHTAELLAELWPKYMDPSVSRIINGAVTETTRLLDLRWEHIFYTGNGAVGRIVAEKAAKWLCPTTLELGGKSPVFIDENANLDIAAHRLMWAKTVNCGQICIAPDYVLCTSSVQDRLIKKLKEVEREFWPDSASKSQDYARIINKRHWTRLDQILQASKGEIVLGGSRREGDLYFSPTIVANVQSEDPLLKDEIFGPILPIHVVADINEGIAYVNSHDQPLALYCFTSQANFKEIIRRTRSGGVAFGDLMLQYFVPSLAFGGTGPSGYGHDHGQAGFDDFSHTRSVIEAPASGVLGRITEAAMAGRYPPYTKTNLWLLRSLMGRKASFKRPEKVYKRKDSSGFLFKISTMISLAAIAVTVLYSHHRIFA